MSTHPTGRPAEAGDAADGVRVRHEVLAEGPARRHIEAVHQRLQLRLRVGQEGSLFLQVGQGSQPLMS